MSIYGNVKRVSSNTFQFDRVFESRRAMDNALRNGSDGVYAGRYVLIEYGERYRRATEEEISNNPNVQEINSVHLIQTEDFTRRANADLTDYGVTYDSTVWQKVYVSNNEYYASVKTENTKLQQRFIMVAELNAITPKLEALTESTYTYEYDNEDENQSLFLLNPDTGKYEQLHYAKEVFNELYFDQVQDTELTYYLHLPSALQLIAGQETIDYNNAGFNPYIYTAPKNLQSFIGWVPTFSNPDTAVTRINDRYVINSAAPLDDRQVNKKTLIMNLTAFGDAIGELYNVLYGKADVEGGLRPFFANQGMTKEDAEYLGSQFDLTQSGNSIDSILANNSTGLAGVLSSIFSEHNPYTNTSRFFLSADWTAESDIWSTALNSNTPTILNKPKIVANKKDIEFRYNFYPDPKKLNPNTDMNTSPSHNLDPLPLSEIERLGYQVAVDTNNRLLRNYGYIPPIDETESLGHYYINYGKAWQLSRIVQDSNIAEEGAAAGTIEINYSDQILVYNVESYHVDDASTYQIPGDPTNFITEPNINSGILFSKNSDNLQEFTLWNNLDDTQVWRNKYSNTVNAIVSKNGQYSIQGRGSVPNAAYAFTPFSYNIMSPNSILRPIFQSANDNDLQSLKLYIHVKLNNAIDLTNSYQAYLYKLAGRIAYCASTTLNSISKDIVFVFDLLPYFNALKAYDLLYDNNNPINFVVLTNKAANDVTGSNPVLLNIEDISYVATYPQEIIPTEEDEYIVIYDDATVQSISSTSATIPGEQIIYQPGYTKLHEGTFLSNGNQYCFPYENTVNMIDADYLEGKAILPNTQYQFVAAKFSQGNCLNLVANKNRFITDMYMWVHVRFDGPIIPFDKTKQQIFFVSPTQDVKFISSYKCSFIGDTLQEGYFIINLHSWIEALAFAEMYNYAGTNDLIGYLVIVSTTTEDCNFANPAYIRILDISYRGSTLIADDETITRTISAGIGDELPVNYSLENKNIIYNKEEAFNFRVGEFQEFNVDTNFVEESTTNSVQINEGIIGTADNPNTNYKFIPLTFSTTNSSRLITMYNAYKNVYLYVHFKYDDQFYEANHLDRSVYLYTTINDTIYQANSVYSGYNGNEFLYVFNLTNYFDNIVFYEQNFDFATFNGILFSLAIFGKTHSTVDFENKGYITLLDVSYEGDALKPGQTEPEPDEPDPTEPTPDPDPDDPNNDDPENSDPDDPNNDDFNPDDDFIDNNDNSDSGTEDDENPTDIEPDNGTDDPDNP